MRTIVDLPDEHVQALDIIGEKQDLSRAELVRRAVADYLGNQQQSQKSLLDKYFGMLKGSTDFDNMDGVAWQKKMRAEGGGREADMDRRIAESEAAGFHESQPEPYKSK